MMRLKRRERSLIIGLAIFIAASVSFVFCIRPAAARIETLSRVIPKKERALEELRTKSVEYLALRAGLDHLDNEAAGGEEGLELLAFLESIIAELHLTRKVTTMKPEMVRLDSGYREVIVEIKLENVTLEQLVDFLLKTKSSERLLRTKSLHAKKNAAGPGLLDTTVQVSALELNPTM